MCTTKDNSSNSIESPWDFHGNFPAFIICHISIHEEAYERKCGWCWFIKDSEVAIWAIQIELIGQTGIVVYMFWDEVWVVSIANFFYANFIVFKAFFKLRKFIVGLLEKVERKGEEEWGWHPEDRDEDEVSVLIFAIPAHFLNALPESHEFLLHSVLTPNWWRGVIRVALLWLLDG